MLVAMPMIAGAAPVAGEPVAGNAGSPTATNAPKYALKGEGAGDEKSATASYVKGAYNAVIKGINNTQDEINTLNTGITTYRNAIGHLTDGKATKTGTVATIKSARTNESIATSSVRFNNVTPTSISATASGNVNLSIPVMADWESDSAADDPVQVTTSFSGLNVDDLAMSAPTTNTATLTKTGITGNVDVGKYLAHFDFTKLIDVDGDAYAGKSAIYPDGSNQGDYSGLSNGEWTVTWNNYGTAKGTSMCSSTSGQPGQAEGPYCWCKMTGWKPKGGTETPMPSFWVSKERNSTASECAYYCAAHCSVYVKADFYNMRESLFSNVQ